MPELTGPMLMALAGLLAHWSFVQMWLTDRGGLAYLWNLKRNNPTLMLIRVSLVAGVVCASLMAIQALRMTFAVGAGFLFLIHLVSLAIFKDHL